MKYIINLTIVFDPENQSLLVRNNHQLKVELSNPATRLLTEFIKNNKFELTRETLIKRVWEDFGFSPSSASLSNHISELRKAFAALELSTKILITVPRVGFKMEAEIHPETRMQVDSVTAENIEHAPSSYESSAEKNTKPTLINKKIVGKFKKKPFSIKMAALVLILVLIILAIMAIYVAMPRDHRPRLVGIEGKCRIYTLNDNQQGNKQFDTAKRMLANKRIDCTQTQQNIYYMEARPEEGLFKIHFMAACTLNDNVDHTDCSNYKLVE